jgi:hypothetical protein
MPDPFAGGIAASQRAMERRFASVTAEQVTITLDADGHASDTLDPDTLQLVPPDGDTETIYTGPALMSPGSTRVEPGVVAGAGSYPDTYEVKLPHTAPKIPIGANLHVDHSLDPELDGRDLTVDGPVGTGRAITRRFTAHANVRGPRR